MGGGFPRCVRALPGQRQAGVRQQGPSCRARRDRPHSWRRRHRGARASVIGRHAGTDRGVCARRNRRRRGSSPEPFVRGHRAARRAGRTFFAGAERWLRLAWRDGRPAPARHDARAPSVAGTTGRSRARTRGITQRGAAMELRGRVALVTGAGLRVGRAIAVALGGRGMRVAVHYNATADGARETAKQIEAAGGEAKLFTADLTDASTAPRLIAEVVAAFGALDVLVNSAAVMVRTPFGEVTPKQWDSVMALNVRAPFFLAQAAAPHLRKARGAIVNIADLAAFETWPGYIPHGISKSGVVYLTRALASVLAPEVRVAASAPGTVLLPEGWTEEDTLRLRKTTPLA